MSLYDEAVERFQEILQQARETGRPEHDAMTLATVRADGRPSARTVLLKAVDRRGFVFYTNRYSRKGEQLASNPNAALCFFWVELGRQVQVEGVVENVSDAEADAYFASRPRLSQLGAWASRQSQPLPDPDRLIEEVRRVDERYAGSDVPRPPFWGGYRVVPRLLEFWASREGRLHVRERYECDDSGRWTHSYLNP